MTAARARRAWAAPIAAHVFVLLCALVAIGAFVGTSASFSADEGAAIVQARQLGEHHTWITRHPVAAADPSGRWFPYELSEHGRKGFAPFAKHPAYSFMLGGLWRLGGINALVFLSILGTAGAALAAALVARRRDPVYTRPTLWAVGIGSPLLFDGYLVIAHALGAAAAGMLVIALTSPRARRAWVAPASVAVLAAVLVLLRTEGLLLVGAVAVVGLSFRLTRLRGVAAFGGGALAWVLERAWASQIVGPSTASNVAYNAAPGGLKGRVDSAVTTLVQPSYRAGRTADALLVVALVLMAAAVVMARRRSDTSTVLAILSATAVVARVVLGPAGAVPGLFVACPALWAGLWAGIYRQREIAERVVFLVAGLFALLVLATQYAEGGGAEWGGRYFALALPLVIPLAVVAIHALPRPVVVSVAVASLAIAVLAAGSLRSSHVKTNRLLDAIPASDQGVAITTAGLLPRLDWQAEGRRHWLLIHPSEIADALAHLRAAGVHDTVVVFPDSDPPDGWAQRGAPVPGFAWRVAPVVLG